MSHTWFSVLRVWMASRAQGETVATITSFDDGRPLVGPPLAPCPPGPLEMKQSWSRWVNRESRKGTVTVPGPEEAADDSSEVSESFRMWGFHTCSKHY